MSRKVVISGVGPATAIGVGRHEFAAALAVGRNGFAPTDFNPPEGDPRLAARIRGLDVNRYLRSTKNYLDRNTELAFAACELARRDANLDLAAVDPLRLAISFGTAWGNLATLALFNEALVKKGPRFVSPMLFPHAYPNTTISLLSIEYGVRGVNQNFAGFDTSGAEALAHAFWTVADGLADVALAGAADALTRELYAAFSAAGALSSGANEGARPFARDRNGATLGEGAAFFTFESAEHCRARGGRPLAVITAAACAGDSLAVLKQLRFPGDEGGGISAIFTSASGDRETDRREAEAIISVFDSPTPPIIAVKSLCGETLGASGAISLAAAVETLAAGIIPPTAASAACEFSGLRLCREPRPLGEGAALVHTCDRGGQAVAITLTSPQKNTPRRNA